MATTPQISEAHRDTVEWHVLTQMLARARDKEYDYVRGSGLVRAWLPWLPQRRRDEQGRGW